MKKLMLMALFGIFALGASAQTWGELYGVVLDPQGQPLPGATVIAQAGDKMVPTATDMDGQFRLKPLNPGIYSVKITFIGLADVRMEGVQVKPDQSLNLKEIRLVEDAQLIGEAEVIWYENPLINPEETSKITTLAADIKNSPAKRDIKGIIATMTADVKIDPVTQELHFRGARGNTVQYIVDGMKVQGNFGGIPASGIGSVSVYTGGVPAKYGDFTGGVIVIESKNYFDLYNEWYYSQQ